MCERVEVVEKFDIADTGLIGETSSFKPGSDTEEAIMVEFFGSDDMEELECKNEPIGGLGASFFFLRTGTLGATCNSCKSLGGITNI